MVAKFSADSVSSEYESVSVSDLLNVNLYNYSDQYTRSRRSRRPGAKRACVLEHAIEVSPKSNIRRTVRDKYRVSNVYFNS